MILSISGKIGSGKDTVGRIIQEFTCNLKDRPDLDSIESRIEKMLQPNRLKESNHISKRDTFEIKKYAAKVKQIASLLLGVQPSMFEDRDFKDSKLGPEWDNMTVREFLQKLGTDAMRMGLHENVWVNALFADYEARVKGKAHDLEDFSELYSHEECYNCKKSYNGYKRQYLCKDCIEDDSVQFYPKWIITDTRFPNELKAVEEHNGTTIKVVRPETDHLAGDHASETALDNAEFDYVIVNDGSIEDLVKEVQKVLIEEGII